MRWSLCAAAARRTTHLTARPSGHGTGPHFERALVTAYLYINHRAHPPCPHTALTGRHMRELRVAFVLESGRINIDHPMLNMLS
eukprot:7391720-Prymnesium_polylepis.2